MEESQNLEQSESVGGAEETFTSDSISTVEPAGSFNSIEGYQQMHSLLLCPAQWTALLESPISLVRQDSQMEYGDKEEKSRCVRRILSGVELDSIVMVDTGIGKDYKENLSTDSQQGIITSSLINVDEDEESDKIEHDSLANEPLSITLIEAGNEEEEEEEGVSQELEGERKDKEESCKDDNSSVEFKTVSNKIQNGDKKSDDGSTGWNLSHILPLLPSAVVTATSSEESSVDTCRIDETGDELTRGNETPNMSEKSSVPPTPSSDSHLSFSLVPSYLTHSRNISETPSLPPFISSSSSSAYHSRNSSMASQITSDWFDSDSHCTDIDSCIVMQSGDLHRPISLQDSRFKFPDMTSLELKHRLCYSFTDITSPIRVPEHLFVPSPELEDTLRTVDGVVRENVNVHGESFDQKHLLSAMKSSEWIKKEMRRARHSMVQVKVSSKSRHYVHFNVKAGDMFIWEFATKKKDIGFGLLFEPTEVAIVENPEPTDDDNEESPQNKMIPILPILRVNAHSHPAIGSHTATQDGVYEILFDNSYSRFFAKELFYRITTKPSIPNEHYLNQ